MTALRLIGLIVVIFLFSLPATFFMHASPSDWKFSFDAKDDDGVNEPGDDPIADVLCIKGMKEMSDGNYTKAIATFTKAIERDPKNSMAYTGRGDVYALRGETARALQDYTTALRLDPENSAIRERLTLARLELSAK